MDIAHGFLSFLLLLAALGSVIVLVLVIRAMVHRWSGVTLATAWVVCTILVGYVAYRYHCSHSLACDVADVPYWKHFVPRYTVITGATLGAGILAILGTRRLNSLALDIVVGTTATFGGWLVTSLAVFGIADK